VNEHAGDESARLGSTSDSAVGSLSSSTVVVVAGKGGVGKTTVTATLARAAIDRGARVLVIELDGKPQLAALVPGVEVRTLSAAECLEEYLVDHGFARIARRLRSTGVIEVVGAAAPGIDDVVVLGKIKQLERSGRFDLILVDGPAAGHAITFVTSASGLADAVRSGPVRAQALEVAEMLRDPARCQVILVTAPEATPVNEIVDTAFALEESAGVQLGPVVVNGIDPMLIDPDGASRLHPAADVLGEGDEAAAASAAARFRLRRLAMERSALDALAARLPLAQVWLPALQMAGVDARAIGVLVAAMTWAQPVAPPESR